jgi:hypothetical protein
MRVIHLYVSGTRDSIERASAYFRNEAHSALALIPLSQKQFCFNVSGLFPDRTSFDADSFRSHVFRGEQGELDVKFFDVCDGSVLDKPVVIVGAPRSGTTLLFETMAQSRDLWTIGRESHTIFEPKKKRSPDERGNRMDARDADEPTKRLINIGFLSAIRNRSGRLYLDGGDACNLASVRLLEKTPRNSLRIPFIEAVFRECRFIFLYREPWSNIASIIDGWQTPYFNNCCIDGKQWKFLLPPNWRQLIHKSVPEIAAAQWRAANTFILDDLSRIPRERWKFISYEQLVTDPRRALRNIWSFAGLETDAAFDQVLAQPLPQSSSTVSSPSPEKWRRHEDTLSVIVPTLEDVLMRIRGLSSYQDEAP